MENGRFAATIPYHYSGIPKGCRKPRSLSAEHVAIVTLRVGTPGRYPVVYAVDDSLSERRSSRHGDPLPPIERRWGEGQLWRAIIGDSGISGEILAANCFRGGLSSQYDWYRKTQAEILALIDERAAAFVAQYRLIGGQLYETATEQVWTVSEPRWRRDIISISLSDEAACLHSFRLDELDAARACAQQLGIEMSGGDPLPVEVEHDVMVTRPDLLTRPSGRQHAAAVRGWQVVDTLKGATQFEQRLSTWLADPIATVTPPGLVEADARHLLALLHRMRHAVSAIDRAVIDSHIPAA